MDKRSELLSVFSRREQDLDLFDLTIDGYFVYGFLCRELRKRFIDVNSTTADKDTIVQPKKKTCKYVIVSFLQLMALRLFKKHIDTFIYSFYRVDRVGSLFLDKFSDPLVEFSSIKESYVIFEKSNNYVHKTPRAHNSKVVYTDYIEQKAIKYAKRNISSFVAKHRVDFELLWEKLDALMGDLSYSKEWVASRILRDISMMSFYRRFFSLHRIKRFIAPCRAVFLPHMYVCKELNIPVFELQHGVNYSMDSITCLGYGNKHFIPDYFLSYGEIQHAERYGIEPDRIVNIGWAFYDYIKGYLSSDSFNQNHVLVITNNLSINPLFRFIEILASNSPSIVFGVRLHPLARMTEFAQQVVQKNENIVLRDNSINIALELNKYQMVIGDNSTVLVEALNYGKKVGKISFESIVPVYSSEVERNAVWEISGVSSFRDFVNSHHKKGMSYKLYSPFNLVLFEQTIHIN